jgi:hypothetical protein
MTDAPLILLKSIKAHVEKGDRAKDKAEQHYIAAGQYLAILKQNHTKDWRDWEEILRVRLKLSVSRASELMQIAAGRKTVAEVRAATAQRMKQLRGRQSSSSRDEEPTAPLWDAPEKDEEPVSALRPHTPTAPAPLNGAAHQLIDQLVASSSETRCAAVEALINGPRQSQYEPARTAVADLYQALAKAGR